MPAGNTALANDLYSTLGRQLLLLSLAAAVIACALWLRRTRVRDNAEAVIEPRGRRILRISLGVLWVVDGLLQAQPEMPSSFVSQTVAPQLATAPDWLYGLVTPFTRLWTQHPVSADAVTIWLQVGLGLTIIAGGTGRLARLALVGSIAWASFVWVIGELVGGLTATDASWLTGAPGSALMYVLAAVLLLLPMSMWRTGVAARWARGSVGAGLLVGATLQALPRTGFWTAGGLSGTLSETAAMGVPEPLAEPIRALAAAIPPYASVVNAVLVLALVLLGLGLLSGRLPRSLSIATAVLTGFGWWLGQGFGIFGGTGTDPDTGAMVLVLLAAGWPWSLEPEPALPPTASSVRWQPVLRTAGIAVATGALVVLPAAAALTLLGPQTAQAAVGDSGGVVLTDAGTLPQFSLVDQNGQTVRTDQLRGKLVLVAFLDPECYDSCPLVANQLASAVRSLGAPTDSVAIVAVDVNPYFNAVSDVQAFTRAHGLDALAAWHFVTGNHAAVGAVLTALGQGVSVPAVGMIGHPEAVYLFGRNGEQLAALNDTGNEDLSLSYTQLIASELRHFL